MSAMDPAGLMELLADHGSLPEFTHDYLPLIYETIHGGQLLCHICANTWHREGEPLEAHVVHYPMDCDVCGDTVEEK